MTPIQRILCPVDFSEHSRLALTTALDLKRVFGARVDVLHAFHVPHTIQPGLTVWMSTGPTPLWTVAEEQAKTALRAWLEPFELAPDEVNVHFLHEQPAAAITRFAEREGHDLIVMGSHGRSGLQRAVLGSVAESVVRTAPCPVLVMRTTGHLASTDTHKHGSHQQEVRT